MSVAGHQPPPIFRRSLPASAKLTLYLALSLALLVADLRFRYLETLREGVAILTLPLQMAAATPADVVRNVSNYFNGLIGLRRENEALRAAQLADAPQRMRQQALERENAELRALLALRERALEQTIAAEVIYTARDPFARRVILDRGRSEGVEPGLAVVDGAGVVGQVTRAFPFNSEVTLLSDKNQAIAVQLARTGQRAVMFGTGNGLMELRYLAANADVVEGDQLLTSGLDGVFPAGLAVAQVLRVERDQGLAFARIVCRPLAGVERSGAVLVLARAPAPHPRPPERGPEQPDADPRPRGAPRALPPQLTP